MGVGSYPVHDQASVAQRAEEMDRSVYCHGVVEEQAVFTVSDPHTPITKVGVSIEEMGAYRKGHRG